MNKNSLKLSVVTLAVAACFSSNVWAAEDAASAQDVAQLRQQLDDLNQRYETQRTALQALSKRLQQLENSGQGQARLVHAVNKTVVADGDATQNTSQSTGEVSQ